MESGRDGELRRHLLFRTCHLIKLVETRWAKHPWLWATCLDRKTAPSIEPVVLMIFVHTEYVNKIKYLCSATPGPGLCPLSHTLQPLCFRSDLFCVSPSAALVCSPIFFTRTRSRQQIYKISLLTPLSLTLMWIKVNSCLSQRCLCLEIPVWGGN